MRGDFYFGKSERDLFGQFIKECFDGWVISKRMAHSDEEFGLQGVADLLAAKYPRYCGGTYSVQFGSETEEADFDLYTILGALEGMCYNDEAVEVADGFYYVGTYQDWQNDAEAQEFLDELLAEEQGF